MKSKLRPWLRAVNIIVGCTTFFSLPVIMMSPMMFDAPGSSENKLLVFTFYAIISYPIVAIGSLLLAWLLFKKELYKPSFILSLLPFIDLILIIICLSQWN